MIACVELVRLSKLLNVGLKYSYDLQTVSVLNILFKGIIVVIKIF